jgi:hypothetical protein
MSIKASINAPTALARPFSMPSAIKPGFRAEYHEDRIMPDGFIAREVLLHNGPQTITEIQAKAPLASCSMTTVVDRLEKGGPIKGGSTVGEHASQAVAPVTLAPFVRGDFGRLMTAASLCKVEYYLFVRTALSHLCVGICCDADRYGHRDAGEAEVRAIRIRPFRALLPFSSCISDFGSAQRKIARTS